MATEVSDNASTLHEDSHSSYSIVVRTSEVEHADTVAIVRVQLSDEEGRQTDRMTLRQTFSHRKSFRRGHSDLFLITNQPSLGRISTVEVTHDSKHLDADKRRWHLHSVMVLNHDNGKIYNFPHGKWIGINSSAEVGEETSTMLKVVGEGFTVLPDHFKPLF
ncbi:unnamed protein product [Caenorhabditis auriculariae]|uniref:PLAT domain-containing protein n=1 Tax=Caenorhabditis auriculariae TaxID=2777116 RepID=A0A8S1HRK0_9PELO|nr:unnamed protein product [Caenorhabditis auriculariae]